MIESKSPTPARAPITPPKTPQLAPVPQVVYFKRFQMEIDLRDAPPPRDLPVGYFWKAWHSNLVEQHAYVKYRCFEDELDSIVFPCLGDRYGCLRLMQDIASRRGFLPEATWLVGTNVGYVGTVQGVQENHRLGMIQNLGIVPPARDLGLGTCLLLKALQGFRDAGLRRAMLEVTARNVGALRLYRRLGFRRTRTLYKAVETFHFT